MTLDHAGIRDDQLRLILLCCHPALDPDAQVALTLRLVGGLTTAEIAAAYLVPEATLAQRIVRAKRKIAAARIPLTIPAALDERVATVLRRPVPDLQRGLPQPLADSAAVRVDLVDEAIRLTALLVDLVPGRRRGEGAARPGAVPPGAARRPARRRPATWCCWRTRTARGGTRGDRRRPTGCSAEAVAAARARTVPAAGDDRRRCTPTPARPPTPTGRPSPPCTAGCTPSIRRRWSLSTTRSPWPWPTAPGLGLVRLDQITGLERYHLFHAARGELLRRAGDPAGAEARLRPGPRAGPAPGRAAAPRPATRTAHYPERNRPPTGRQE